MLAGVGHAVQAALLRRHEVLAEGLVGKSGFAARKTQSHHDPCGPAGQGPLQGLVCRLYADVAHDVRDQPQGDAIAPLALSDRLDQGGKDFAAVGAVGKVGRDGEMGFGVEDVLGGLLGQEVEDEELEVLGSA